jgi:hypothetical protein
MSYKIPLLLVMMALTSITGAAQTVIKIPFLQPEQFHVSPRNIFKSLEGNTSIELGLEPQIRGGSGVYTFSWTHNNTIIGSDPTITASQKGIYILTIHDGTSCEASITYYIDTITGVNEPAEHPIEIYPNPANNNFYVRLPELIHTANLSIYTLQGVLIRKTPSAVDSPLFQFDSSDLASGSYILVVQNEKIKLSRILIIKH